MVHLRPYSIHLLYCSILRMGDGFWDIVVLLGSLSCFYFLLIPCGKLISRSGLLSNWRFPFSFTPGFLNLCLLRWWTLISLLLCLKRLCCVEILFMFFFIVIVKKRISATILIKNLAERQIIMFQLFCLYLFELWTGSAVLDLFSWNMWWILFSLESRILIIICYFIYEWWNLVQSSQWYDYIWNNFSWNGGYVLFLPL